MVVQLLPLLKVNVRSDDAAATLADDWRASQSPVTIAREVNVNTFARSAPGQPWKLRQRQETRVDFETNARSDQAQA